MYQVKANMSSVHIAGIAEQATGGDSLTYAVSACSALSRGASRFASVGPETDDLAKALASARANHRKLCKTCERKAEAALAS